MEGEEVNSHCGGEKVIFFMDFVMYFLLAVVKELRGGFVGVLTVYWFQRVQNLLCVVKQQEVEKSIAVAMGIVWAHYT